MNRRTSASIAVLLLAAAAPAAHAAGAWSTFLRPYSFSAMVANADTVWAASLEAGLVRYLRSGDRFESDVKDGNGVASDKLTAIAFDRSGRLWVGTLGSGVSVRSPGDGTWRLVNAFDGLPGLGVTSITAYGDSVWIGTTQGIAVWNGFEISGALPDVSTASPFKSDYITGIAQRGDSLWVATHNGVYVSRLSTGLDGWHLQPQNLIDSTTTSLVGDGTDVFVLASQTIERWNESAGQWQAVGSAAGIGRIYRMSESRGNVFAMTDQGIYRWNGAGWDALNGQLVSDGGASTTYAVARDPAGRIFAAAATGLHVQPDAPGTWTRHVFDGLVGNDIQNLAIDGSRVYVATFNEGIGRWDGHAWRNWFSGSSECTCDTSFRASGYAFAMMVDRVGRKWTGHWGSAIESFDDRTSPPDFTHYQFSDTISLSRHTNAWAAAADSNGGRWFGMDTPSLGDPSVAPCGLEYYGPDGIYHANFQTTSGVGMESNQIRAITFAADGRMFVGYASGGVDAFAAPGNPPTTLVQQDDMASTALAYNVFGMQVHRDSLWVLSADSLRLYRFVLNSPNVAVVKSRTFELPGGPAGRGAVHPLDIAPDGTAWAGTGSGLRAYRPDGTTETFDASNSPLEVDEIRAVRVDPLTGAVWIGTASGLHRYDPGYVPPSVARIPLLSATVWPNPALLTGIGLSLRMSGNLPSYHGTIYGVDGRVVRRFVGVANGGTFWDGRDRDGALVKPGIYFVRVEGGGRALTARVALVR